MFEIGILRSIFHFCFVGKFALRIFSTASYFLQVSFFFSRFSGENSQVRGECEENTKYKSCARLVLASNHLKNKSNKKEKELPCFTR